MHHQCGVRVTLQYLPMIDTFLHVPTCYCLGLNHCCLTADTLISFFLNNLTYSEKLYKKIMFEKFHYEDYISSMQIYDKGLGFDIIE